MRIHAQMKINKIDGNIDVAVYIFPIHVAQ